MSSLLPLLKWSEEIFNDLVKIFKFPLSWGVIYPQEGQTAAQAPAGYITLFWNYFAEGNFRLPVTKFVLEVLGYYKFHISQLNPMGMLHCSQSFYSFAQCPTAKKILLVPSRSFHEWKTKFSYIKRGVIPVKTLETKIWYQDIKDVLSVELPEKALVAAKMCLHWKADCHDKPVYVEDDKTDAPKADILKEEKKKGTHPVFDSWCDYVVVSDSLEGLAPVFVKYPKAEPQDTVDIPPSNPEEPIDLESSPEPLVWTKAIKRKKPECEAATQPAKKILRKMISKRGNLNALATKLSPSKCLFQVPIII
ncbi:hypothetical protein Hanom_Chr15g01390251 [Helianthus anomalus]